MNLKRAAQRKLKKSGGFTLVEMLIVVAIIAILVVVSIPLVGSSLDSARKATDDANERAAKGAALVTYMTSKETSDAKYCYDADAGAVTKITSDTCGKTYDYGQGSKKTDDSAARTGHIHVEVNTDGTTKVTWKTVTGTSG